MADVVNHLFMTLILNLLLALCVQQVYGKVPVPDLVPAPCCGCSSTADELERYGCQRWDVTEFWHPDECHMHQWTVVDANGLTTKCFRCVGQCDGAAGSFVQLTGHHWYLRVESTDCQCCDFSFTPNCNNGLPVRCTCQDC